MASSENTPPPEDFQKWWDELYVKLPDLPDTTEDSLKSKYDLRVEIRERINVPITYLDQDDSGTFDPACREPPECMPIDKKKRERRQRADDGTPKKIKSNTWQGGRWSGRQLPVVLRFTSKNGRGALKDFGSSLDNWPEPLPDTDSSDDSPTNYPNPQMKLYNLRERRRCGPSDPANATGDENVPLEDITLGYPAYRGCKACFAWGFRCPLLDEDSRYPCAECTEDDTECELIVEPAVKRTCEGCRSRRQQCSYKEEGGDHTKPCRQCVHAFRKCVAGPASGKTRTGPSLDQGDHRLPRRQHAQIQKHHSQSRIQNAQISTPNIACTKCPQVEDWCSRIIHGEQAECSHCCNRGTIAVATLNTQATMSFNGKEKELEIRSQRLSKPTAVGPTKSHRSQTITTKLAHPIQFNYAYDDDIGLAPCHWCEDAIYGILGLREVKVEVIENEDGQGFIEIAGGHAETHGHSRMCEFCTTDRLKITACRTHSIEPIEGTDPENFDYEAVMEWIMPGMASSAPFAWCSICQSPPGCLNTEPRTQTPILRHSDYLGRSYGIILFTT